MRRRRHAFNMPPPIHPNLHAPPPVLTPPLAPRGRYASEAVKYTPVEYQDNEGCIELIEKTPTGILRVLDTQVRHLAISQHSSQISPHLAIFPVVAQLSPRYLPPSSRISAHLRASRHISPHLATSRHISPHLPTSPHISPHLPTSPPFHVHRSPAPCACALALLSARLPRRATSPSRCR